MVCDGIIGLIKPLSIRNPVLMCQIHLIMIVKRYLIQDPDLDEAHETFSGWSTTLFRWIKKALSVPSMTGIINTRCLTNVRLINGIKHL